MYVCKCVCVCVCESMTLVPLIFEREAQKRVCLLATRKTKPSGCTLTQRQNIRYSHQHTKANRTHVLYAHIQCGYALTMTVAWKRSSPVRTVSTRATFRVNIFRAGKIPGRRRARIGTPPGMVSTTKCWFVTMLQRYLLGKMWMCL
jgi:hypothetical protein